MKPIILYEPNEINFVTNGIGVLNDATSAIVTEERNGIYELTMAYPITGRLFEALSNSCIIKCPVNNNSDYQLFRIYAITKPMNGIVIIHAEHISYQLSYTALAPFIATSAAEAMYKIGANIMTECPFTFWTDKQNVGTYNQVTPDNVRIRLGGTAGSILDVYGGEYEFDNYTVKLHNNRGQNRNVTLRYGKNITDIEQEEKIEAVYTSIVGYWRSEDDVLKTGVINSEYVNNYPYNRTKVVDFSSNFNEKPTLEELTAKATAYMNANNFGIPNISIKVSFVALWQTEEYKNIAPLERVYLCDTVSVYFEKLNITAEAKVVKTQFNVLLEKYDSIELGNVRTNLSNRLAEQANEVQKALVESKSELEKAIDRATQLITGNNGGYVVTRMNAEGKPMELLIMDTDDVSTAQKVWRYNNAGWGYSSTGINGQYRLAATQDGHFVADFIDTGTLTANIIKTGILGDVAGKNYWNMETGAFSLSGNTLIDNNQTLKNIFDGFQDQIDGNITTWFFPGVPTLNNAPANEWNTSTEKDAHLGDLYYDTNTEYAYRFMKTNDVYSWEHLSDSDISAALAVANQAQDTADHKRRIFITQPIPPYDVGDTWMSGENGDILTCINAKTSSQTYAASDWSKLNKYTDDSALTTFLTNTYASDKSDLQGQIDGKAETWYQASDPSNAWTTVSQLNAHLGDLWYKTTDHTTWFYTKENNTYKWVQQDIPTAVFDEIDGKATVFLTTPQPPYHVGDIWFGGSNSSLSAGIYTCINSRETGSYNVNDWAVKNNYATKKYVNDTIGEEIETIDTQQHIFNTLTNNGQTQGIYLQYDSTSQTYKLYINAQYIATGVLADRAGKFSLNMTTGVLSMKDGSFEGTITGSTIQTAEVSSYDEEEEEEIINPRMVMDKSTSLKGYYGDELYNLINMEQEISGTHQMTIDADTQLNIRTPNLYVVNQSAGTGTATVYQTLNRNSVSFVSDVKKDMTDPQCVEGNVNVGGTNVYCTLPVFLKVTKSSTNYKLGMRLSGESSTSVII